MMHPFLWVVSCQKVSRCPLASAFFTISQDGVEFALELGQFGLKLPKSAKLFLPYLSISGKHNFPQYHHLLDFPGVLLKGCFLPVCVSTCLMNMHHCTIFSWLSFVSQIFLCANHKETMPMKSIENVFFFFFAWLFLAADEMHLWLIWLQASNRLKTMSHQTNFHAGRL